MSINIGSAYKETKERIERKIIEREIGVTEITAENNACCYLCMGRIDGEMIILKEAGLINGKFFAEQNYFVHESCYEKVNLKTQISPLF